MVVMKLLSYWSLACLSCLFSVTACQQVTPVSLESPIIGEGAIHNGYKNPTLYTDMGDQELAIAPIHNYNESSICSGVYITPQIILTAAHCLIDEISPDDIFVNLPNSHSSFAKVAAFEIFTKNGKNFQTAHDYTYDLAAIILEQPTEITPIPVHQGSLEQIFGHEAQAVGFGLDESNNSHFINLLYWTTIMVENLVAGQIHVQGYNHSGLAPGDSGSPLLYDFGQGPEVVGISSTTENFGDKDYTWGANYTPLDIHTNWIFNLIYKYSDEKCYQSCHEHCGTIDGCYCGSCFTGEECQADHLCHPKTAGQGGTCFDLWNHDGATECENDSDCNNGLSCLYNPYLVHKICAAECAPQNCSPLDDEAVCFPYKYGDYYTAFCIEENPAPCSNKNDHCITNIGTIGSCMEFYSGRLGCYAGCTAVDTCHKNEGCLSRIAETPEEGCTATTATPWGTLLAIILWLCGKFVSGTNSPKKRKL